MKKTYTMFVFICFVFFIGCTTQQKPETTLIIPAPDYVSSILIKYPLVIELINKSREVDFYPDDTMRNYTVDKGYYPNEQAFLIRRINGTSNLYFRIAPSFNPYTGRRYVDISQKHYEEYLAFLNELLNDKQFVEERAKRWGQSYRPIQSFDSINNAIQSFLKNQPPTLRLDLINSYTSYTITLNDDRDNVLLDNVRRNTLDNNLLSDGNKLLIYLKNQRENSHIGLYINNSLDGNEIKPVKDNFQYASYPEVSRAFIIELLDRLDKHNLFNAEQKIASVQPDSNKKIYKVIDYELQKEIQVNDYESWVNSIRLTIVHDISNRNMADLVVNTYYRNAFLGDGTLISRELLYKMTIPAFGSQTFKKITDYVSQELSKSGSNNEHNVLVSSQLVGMLIIKDLCKIKLEEK